jgi:hypothetical protein
MQLAKQNRPLLVVFFHAEWGEFWQEDMLHAIKKEFLIRY